MKKIASMLLCFLLLFLCSVTAFAAESVDEGAPSKDVVISVTVPDGQKITVIADGATVSLDGAFGTEFTVNRQSTPKILIKANTGKVIECVKLGDVDVTDKLQDGYLTLEPVYMNLTLTVTTKAAPNSDTDSPQTGDTSNLWLWWILPIVSAACFVLLALGQRKRKELN